MIRAPLPKKLLRLLSRGRPLASLHLISGRHRHSMRASCAPSGPCLLSSLSLELYPPHTQTRARLIVSMADRRQKAVSRLIGHPCCVPRNDAAVSGACLVHPRERVAPPPHSCSRPPCLTAVARKPTPRHWRLARRRGTRDGASTSPQPFPDRSESISGQGNDNPHDPQSAFCGVEWAAINGFPLP